MAKTNPFEFLQDVRSEASKITWPTRRETLITTIMVFIFATAAALFFLLVDMVLRYGIGFILGV